MRPTFSENKTAFLSPEKNSETQINVAVSFGDDLASVAVFKQPNISISNYAIKIDKQKIKG